jgi:hypothetical protein
LRCGVVIVTPNQLDLWDVLLIKKDMGLIMSNKIRDTQSTLGFWPANKVVGSQRFRHV